jgi:hypothetical protein
VEKLLRVKFGYYPGIGLEELWKPKKDLNPYSLRLGRDLHPEGPEHKT